MASKGRSSLIYILFLIVFVLLGYQWRTQNINHSRIFYDYKNILDSNYDDKYEELPSWPEEAKIQGSLRQWQQTVFDGKELVGVLWKSEAGTLKIENHPYDQIVFVIKGKVLLTNSRGVSKNYSAGEMFIIPKGFSGYWEMPQMYEEFIIVEKQTFILNP